MFPSGGWQIPSDSPILNRIAPLLARLQSTQIVVSGFTDNTPVGAQLKRLGIANNQDLSTKRASSVVDYLASHGVNPALLSAQGYYFRILTAQGDNAAGGSMNYLVNRRMTKDFALIAWPTVYGVSGIMTLAVNQDGVIYQKDLGAATGSEAPKVQSFDPDLRWVRIDIVNR